MKSLLLRATFLGFVLGVLVGLAAWAVTVGNDAMPDAAGWLGCTLAALAFVEEFIAEARR